MYSVELSTEAEKELKKLDKHQSKIITAWIRKNLHGCDNPRLYGKSLSHEHKGKWRYRVGDYRLIANIHDNIVTIEIIKVGHRRGVYD